MLTGFVLEDSLVVVGRCVRELAILNATGRLVWERRERGWDADRIAAYLSREYGIGGEQARRDVAACLESWACAGLLDAAGEEEAEALERAIHPAADRARRPIRDCFQEDYALGGNAFRVGYGSQELREAAAPLVAHLATPSQDGACRSIQLADTGNEYWLWRDGRCIACSATRAGLMVALHQELLEIGYEREWCVGLHAAAIADGNVSVVLAGQGGSGKSTLTAVLLQSGFVYLSDDVVPLDAESRAAMPLPVSLNLKSGSLPVLERYYPGIGALPGYPAGGATVHYFPPPGFAANPPRGTYPVKRLVFPRYQAGARTELRAIGAVEALRRLIEGDSVVRRWSAASVGELVDWIPTVPACSLVYGNVDEAAACVRGLFER